MKRLFYTDPLKAAYMCAEFEVEFFELTDYHGMKGSKYSRGYGSFFYQRRNNGQVLPTTFEGGEEVKHYIHPDSEHIFEPQEGDKDEDGFRYVNDGEGQWQRYEMNGRLRMFDAEESCVSKRNNKHFFWPESEEIE